MARVFHVDRDQIIADVQSRCEPEELSAHPLSLSPVRTYVGDMKTLASGGFPGVVVPPFASHWGVVVGSILYHLTFREDSDAQSESGDSTRKGKPIQFTLALKSPENIEDSPIVGKTKYDHEGLIKIGRALLEAFGSYHRLFWNCQIFADCFLRLITDGANSFPEYTYILPTTNVFADR